MRFRMLAAVTSLMLTLAATPGVAQEAAAPDTTIPVAGARQRITPQARTGWMFGVGAGYGLAGPKTPAESPDQESGGTIHARIGCGVSPRAMVGVEYLTWAASPTDSTSWDLLAAGPSVTWYWPSNLYVRGMLGWAMGKAEFENASTPTTMVEIVDDGFACLLAAGWEFRFRRRLGIAPEVQYLKLGMSNRSTYELMSGSLSINWYY